jgi:tryptophan synthase beta chain
MKDYVGRESYAKRLSESYRREDGSMPHIYLKREDLNHTGAHKINNSLKRFSACEWARSESSLRDAGQHGVATATVCARFGLECIIYMGTRDMERQSLNVSACAFSALRFAV